MRKLVILLLFALPFIFACTKNKKAEGESLAKVHCGGCHQFPTPNLLAKPEWEALLPKMALRLGVKSEFEKLDSVNAFDQEVFSKTQLVSEKEWLAIKDYYLSLAPDQLNNSQKTTLTLLRNRFEVKFPQVLSEEVPNITAIKIDEKRHQVYAADEINKQIYFLNKNSQIVANFRGLPAISDMQLKPNGLFVTYMGRDIRLTKQRNGYNELVDIEGIRITKTSVQSKSLYRPTVSILSDLNKDGADEMIVCEFGVNEGKFTINKKTGSQYVPFIEENKPGAIHSQVIDFDKDGDLDVLVLFAQGDEQLVLYKNKGSLQFEREQILRFPPVYGSNHFEVVDIDLDGKFDILYTCGDNADYSITQKPYHGVYVFRNTGNETFKKIHFFPIDGATKTLARDFDNDGDIDMAAIAFFADFSNPRSSNFIYLENEKGKFTAKGLDIQRLGRWLVMDAADLDGDKDIDITLGSHPFGETISPHLDSWRSSTGVLVLVNQTK
jgi:FG-GAP-like repeat